jgi:hypothetical protein
MINSNRLNIIICAVYFGYPLHSRILLLPLEIMVCIQIIILQCTCNAIFQVVSNRKDPWDHLMYTWPSSILLVLYYTWDQRLNPHLCLFSRAIGFQYLKQDLKVHHLIKGSMYSQTMSFK